MSHRTFFAGCLVLLLLPLGVQAEKSAQPDGAVWAVSADTKQRGDDDDDQRRRAELRTSLKSQQQSAAAAPLRKLSPQDRADLRQQLRQLSRDGDR